MIENEYGTLPPCIELDEIDLLFSKLIKKEIKHELSETYLFLVSDDFIQKVNFQKRNKNVPTDVLSFPYQTNLEQNMPCIILGEIMISLDKVREQSILVGHSQREEFFRLLVHGFLHLLGFDHIKKDDEIIMQAKENECLNFILG